MDKIGLQAHLCFSYGMINSLFCWWRNTIKKRQNETADWSWIHSFILHLHSTLHCQQMTVGVFRITCSNECCVEIKVLSPRLPRLHGFLNYSLATSRKSKSQQKSQFKGSNLLEYNQTAGVEITPLLCHAKHSKLLQRKHHASRVLKMPPHLHSLNYSPQAGLIAKITQV